MMILAVLSHGRDGHVYASDGKVVATESIYEKFNNSGCPNLRGKPKFFIIQVSVSEMLYATSRIVASYMHMSSLV